MPKVKAKPKVSLDSKEIADRLAIKFEPPEWALFFEVRSEVGYGACQRYADAIGMTTYPSRGLKFHGFEFKSNRSDLLSEIKDGAKSAVIQKYCDHWWLVLGHKDIIRAGELPATWGLIVPYGGGLQIVVKAPELKPCALDRPFVASLLRSAKKDEMDDSQVSQLENEGFMRGRKIGLAEVGQELKHLRRYVEQFEKESGVDIADEWNHGQIGTVVKYIMDSGIESMNRKLRYYLREVQRATENIDKILKELEKDDAAKILRDPTNE